MSSTDAFTRIVTIAIEQDVDAVIHTGDIVEVDRETLDTASARLELLAKVGIPVDYIIGSHDRNSYAPQHANSVMGSLGYNNRLERVPVDLSTSPTPVAGRPLDAYGIPAENTRIDDVAKFELLGWKPSDMEFGSSSSGPNVLCLHDGVTPYRDRSTADIVDSGYSFETQDGMPVFYTGPALRISEPYRERDAFVTELTISTKGVTETRHTI